LGFYFVVSVGCVTQFVYQTLEYRAGLEFLGVSECEE